VKTAVPIYGCGYNYDRRNVRWGLPEPSANLITFQRILSPEAHAPYVACPLLFLSATNDFHGLFDRAYEALGAATGPTFQAFTPRTNHHLEPQQGRNLPLWMDSQLKGRPAWPRTPDLRLALDDQGVPVASVVPGPGAEVSRVEVFYALGDKRPQARFWRTGRVNQRGPRWESALPVLDPWDDLRAFANVTYTSGVCLSSPLRHVIPAQIGKARATLAPSRSLEQGEQGLDHWTFTNGYTDPLHDWSYLETGHDETAGPYVTFAAQHLGDPIDARLSTHLIGDPQYQGGDGQVLAFLCRGGFDDAGLTVSVIEEDWGPRSRTYTATVPKNDLVPGWREVRLPLARFVDRDGKSPARWGVLDKLEVRARGARSDPPRFARWRWIDPHDDKK
jgi:hypothetical protein